MALGLCLIRNGLAGAHKIILKRSLRSPFSHQPNDQAENKGPGRQEQYPKRDPPSPFDGRRMHHEPVERLLPVAQDQSGQMESQFISNSLNKQEEAKAEITIQYFGGQDNTGKQNQWPVGLVDE